MAETNDTTPSQAGPNKPIDMILPCPSCGGLHVDAPEPESGWANPPHKSHMCHFCGTIWRPADVPTNGVARIETRGEADTWPPRLGSVPTMNEIQAAANARRIALGMTWRQVAAAVNCTPSTLSRWTWRGGAPSAQTLLAVWRWTLTVGAP